MQGVYFGPKTKIFAYANKHQREFHIQASNFLLDSLSATMKFSSKWKGFKHGKFQW